MLKPVSIKECIKGADGRDILVINIAYPCWTEHGAFSKTANAFYKSNADAFYDFAKHTLIKRASHTDEPMAAVFMTKVTLNGKNYASSVSEASVFDGEAVTARSRSSGIWSKRTRSLLRWSDVFAPEASKMLENADKRFFYATESGITVGIGSDGSQFIDYATLTSSGLIKIAP